MACCKNKPGEVPTVLSCRYMMAYVGFFGFMWVYALRFNISVAIVCMSKVPNDTMKIEVNTTAPPEEDCGNGGNETVKRIEGEFEWSRQLQGVVLSSFFWGYIVTQVPGGWLAARYGGKIVFGAGMLLTSVATLLIPVGARGHVGVVIFLRILMGAGTGVVFPAMHGLWARWAPALERTKLITLTYAGTMIGNIFTFFVSGLLCEYGFAGGWPSIFYIMGIASAVWLILWGVFVFDNPSKHPRITDTEKDYILSSIGTNTFKDSTKMKTPWLAFCKSLPLWAIIVGHVCNNWANYTLMTSLPSYMKDVLKFNMKSNGFFSALPYMGMFVASIGGGQVADILRARGIPTTKVRKGVQFIAFVVPSIFVIAVGFLDCTQRMLAVAFLTIAVTTTALCRSGYIVNHVDIAPRYAGILFGITNTFATLPGMIAPVVVGQITQDRSRASWQIVFFICAGFYLFGAVFYTIFASGVEQEWAKAPPSDDQNNADHDGKDGEAGIPLTSMEADKPTNV
ncbi:sialin-like isoform X3 [Tubulanus polymorphus]|uniref:sialin-like isoform X3 n=1 Tax=Tubulanus polymorphus TaxID=672921 RepID=UPI003DA642F8